MRTVSRSAARTCSPAHVTYYVYYVIALCNATSADQLFFARDHVLPPPLGYVARSKSRIDIIINISVQNSRNEMKLESAES